MFMICWVLLQLIVPAPVQTLHSNKASAAAAAAVTQASFSIYIEERDLTSPLLHRNMHFEIILYKCIYIHCFTKYIYTNVCVYYPETFHINAYAFPVYEWDINNSSHKYVRIYFKLYFFNINVSSIVEKKKNKQII